MSTITSGVVQVKDLQGGVFNNNWKITGDDKLPLETLTVEYGQCGHPYALAFGKGFAFAGKDQYTTRTECWYCTNSKLVRISEKDPNSILYIGAKK